VNSFGRKFFPTPAQDTDGIPQLGEVLVTGADLPRPSQGPAVDDDDLFPRPNLVTADSSGAAIVDAGAVKPVATIAQLADYLVNGFWAFNHASAHHWASSTISYNIDGLNAAEQFLAQSAMNAWHEVANVSFVRTSGSANITFNHNGTMVAVTNAGWNGLGQITSATVDISADWITNDGGARDGKTGIDSYGYQTYIHEIGHALGLGHQGPYNGSATYSVNATYADDTWQYSIMSYFSQGNYSGSTSRYVITPQVADIYAVDAIYGAAVTRSGDTVYGFHNTAGAIFDFSAYSPAPALTIYDSGGNDTLDCSGYSNAQTIDLHGGSFLSIGGLTNNIGIATNATIENAIGGSGNDTLVANDLGCTLTGGGGNDTLIGGAGSDRLVGGGGTDVMSGGGGTDTFLFSTGDSSAAANQHDRISDFVSGDHIDLSGIDAVSASSVYDQFHYLGAAAFDGAAGALDYFYNSTLGVTVLQGDTNGDRVADFAIDLAGNIAISAGDLYGITVSSTTFYSDAAANNFVGVPGADTVSYANSATGVIIDLVHQLTWDGHVYDTLSGIENAIGSNFNDTFYSNALANRFDGSAGIDTVSYSASSTAVIIDLIAQATWDGAVGDKLSGIENAIGSPNSDFLYGDAGNNVLDGGNGGIDFISGGAGSDTVSYASSVSGMIIDLAGQATWDGGSGDKLSSIENAIGSSNSDFLYGDASNNVLDGGNGGIDFISGGAGSDTVSYAGSASGMIIDLAGQATWDGGSGDTLSSIENAIGSSNSDFLYGDAGNNVLDPGRGGIDFISGGAGNDTVTYASSTSALIIDLAGATWDGGSGDTLSSIENATGSSNNDFLYGDANANVLDGGPGTDSLSGGAGNDSFVFHKGEANGDTIMDFNGNGAAAGDQLRFTGYGTAAQGATLTSIDATHWSINSADGLVHDTITLANGASIHASDYFFI
jgi:Ca2+-binding RTX toxin-like protein